MVVETVVSDRPVISFSFLLRPVLTIIHHLVPISLTFLSTAPTVSSLAVEWRIDVRWDWW